MGSWFSSGSASPEVEEFVSQKIAQHCVVVFSKTTCPYCGMAKKVLNEIGKPYEVVELDSREDGSDIQDYLESKTGARSVPRVFINGECIGGGSETRSLHQQGKLVPLIEKCRL